MAKIGWQHVVGFVTLSTSPPAGVAGFEGVLLPSWTLVNARRGQQPSKVDDRSLEPDNVDHYFGASAATDDDDWASHLPKQEQLASFHYAAFCRASNVVWPHITQAVTVPGKAHPSWIGEATPVTIEGELGRASVDISIIALETKTVVCSGRIENVAPTSFAAIGSGRDDREAARDALSDRTVAMFAWVGLERAINGACLLAHFTTPWPDVFHSYY